MRKSTLLSCIVIVMVWLMSGSLMMASPISEKQAHSIALNFMTERQMKSAHVQLAHKSARLASSSSEVAYYVFNASAQDGGYVIVAGDDLAPAVLGYSDSGTFDPSDVPPAMAELLDGYAAQIQAIGRGYCAAQLPSSGAAIRPLVKACWSQNSPYNILFPFLSNGKHAMTGCVATAMAQVMHYYKWPSRPSQPIPAYTTKELSIFMPELPVVDFAWDQMQNTYQTTDTVSAAARAVATLSLYCAQSVNMNFMTGGSSASASDLPAVMSSYFGYKPSARYVLRMNYSSSTWNDMIYSELAASRPVVMRGANAGGGHAFICDGYDGNGMFHINWGWNGDSNGYFLLNVLNSDTQDLGFVSDDAYGYIKNQEAVVGIEPGPGGTSVFELTSSDMTLDSYSGSRTSSSGTFSAIVSGEFHNKTSQTMAVDMGWGLYRGDELLTTLYSTYIATLRPNYYVPLKNKTLTFGGGLTSGTYRIKPIYSERNAGKWRPCVGANLNYIEVTINGNSCTFKGCGALGSPNYRVGNINVEGNMHPNRPLEISVELTNLGDSYNDELYMHVNGKMKAMGLVSLEKGETGHVFYHLVPESTGTYTLSFSFNENGSSPIATRSVTIVAMPAASLSASVQVLNVSDSHNRVITSDKFSVEMTVTNTGTSRYDEDISLRLYKHIYGNTGTAVQGVKRRVSLAAGEKTTVRFDLDNVLDGWKYFVISYYYSSGEQVRLKSSSTYTIKFPEEPQTRPGDVNGDGEINIADVNAIIGMILDGRPLPAGDVNGDHEVNIADVNVLIGWIMNSALS